MRRKMISDEKILYRKGLPEYEGNKNMSTKNILQQNSFVEK
jgi:hypothetical protein